MRVRILIAAAAVSSGWLGACSKPASQEARTADPNEAAAARHILLAETPRPDGAVISNLEANRAAKVVSRTVPAPAKASRALPAVAVAAAPVHEHEMVMTTSSMAPALRTMDLAPVPVARAIPAATTLAEGHFLPGNDGEYFPARGVGTSPRGPTIIIRGGPGGPDDDCDLRNMHPRRIATAVNRSAPAFQGGLSTRPRGIR